MTSKARDIADLGSNDVLETSSTGVEVTGNVSLGDNGKVKLGAGDDLQIYHTGTQNYIEDAGTGNLNFKSNGNFYNFLDGSNATVFQIDLDDATRLYHNTTQKLATTSTGVDVTGTISADGLTVDGGAYSEIYLDSNLGALSYESSSGDFRFYNAGSKRLNIANNGDVSFYEDTGTTAKMVWSSSAEGLELSSLTSYVVTNSGKAVGGLDIKGAYNGLNTYGAGISLGTGGTGRSAIAAVAQHASDNDANGLAFFIHGSSGSTADSSEAMRIDASGNVGIGTDSPATPLHISGTTPTALIQSTSGDSAVQIQASDGSYASTLRFGDNIDGDVGRIHYTHSNNAMSFYTGATERARIDSSGNLLVGQTTPSNITAGMYVRPSSSSGIIADGAGALTLGRLNSDGDIVNFLKDGSPVGSIKSISSGGGGISIDNEGSEFNLDMNGGSNSTSNTFFSRATLAPFTDNYYDVGRSSNRYKDLYLSGGVITSSDYRLKEDIQPMQSYADTVKQMNLVNFAWKESGEREDGFIAHELQDLVPNAVRGNKDAVNEDGEAQYQGVDPLKLIPVLTKALQEALERIETLENN